MNNTEAINKEIYEEALRWVHGNKGTTINPNAASYPSPRISSELPDCSMPLTFDSYNFCSLGCSYCFAYIFKLNNPSLSTKEIQLKSINVNHLIDVMSGKFKSDYDQAFYEYFYKNKFLFHWGGLADPFCNFELANGVGYKLMNFLGDMNYPTLFSFKGATIFQKKYSDLFAKFSDQANFAFQVSMVTADDNMAKTVEVGVPLPQKRFAALKMLSDMGYWTILRLRPFIIGVTDCSLDELLNKALASGINAVSMEFYAMDVRAPVAMRARYEWLAKAIGVSGGADGLMSYFKHLSPSERGSYLRLNRLVKEIYVK
ncbi:MAG: hypothetical protein KKH44_06970, partial [Bacteroidetes bacterium]|nr:hypothetical protein [Bacteroidota bacterium]